MAFDIQAHRRKERWLVGKAGLDDDTRRDLLQRVTGHRSTTEIAPRQWAPYLDALERLANVPPSPRVTQEPLPYPLDGGPTPAQLAEIERLRARIAWTHPAGPEAGFRAFVAKCCFTEGEEVERHAWEQCGGTMRSLPIRIISRIIRRLKREAAYRPALRACQEAPNA